jgi:lambda family phage portal protein
MKPVYSLIDRAIGWFDPAAGLRRALARRSLSKVRAYEGATSMDGWIPRRQGASANADHRADSPMLRARARALVQNNPYAAKALGCLVSNVVGEGIIPSSRATDERTRLALDALWREWMQVADADNGTDFNGLEAQAYRAMEQDGEVLLRLRTRRPEDGLPVPLQVQLLEIDYLDTSKNGALQGGGQIVSGIEFDSLGRVAAYWLRDAHPGDASMVSLKASISSRRHDARNIIHLFAPDRPGQARGITRFAPVIARLRDLAIYEDAELARKQNEALMSVFVSGDGADFAVPGAGESASAASDRAATMGELGSLKPGAILATNGQSITVAEPKAAPGYDLYIRTQLYAIAAGTGVTYEMLTGDLSQVNFSSARVGMMEFRRSAEQRQWHVLVPRLLQPIWRAFIDAAVLSGRVPRADYAVEWTTPKWDYVNPLQDVEADAAEIAAGLSSVSEKLRQRGYQPDAVFKELGEDYAKLKASGALDYLGFLKTKTLPPTAAPVDDAPPTKPKRDDAGDMMTRAGEVVGSAMVAAIREMPRPEYHFHAGDTNVSAADVNIENRMPEQPAPINQISVAPSAAEVRVENHVPAQAAPVVNVAPSAAMVEVRNEVQTPAISEVRIVGMPDRETSTDVKRDKAGNIVTTTQTEKDA